MGSTGFKRQIVVLIMILAPASFRTGVAFALDPKKAITRYVHDAWSLPPNTSFLDPKKVRFKYQLEGYDENWIDAGTRRVTYYTNLSPGACRFRVIGCNNDRARNESGAALALYLQPHFYETRWFYALCAVLGGIVLILAGLVGYYLRVRQSRERERTREKELAILVDKRTKDLQEAKRELEEMNQNLERRVQQGIKTLGEAERMAAYGQMVAGVAHEVRNPLFALQTAAYVIEEMISGPEEVKSQLDVIQQETGRLRRLMGDLLDFGSPKPLQLAPTSVEGLLKEAAATYQTEHDPNFPKIVLMTGGQAENRSQQGLPPIPMDRSRMVQVLVNLIENAAKHAKGLSTVSVSAEISPQKPPQVWIRVADDGAGIDPTHLPEIFNPFFTTGKGTGLGLAIVRRIIKGHGGTITAESQPEKGTIFTISLPVKKTDDDFHAAQT